MKRPLTFKLGPANESYAEMRTSGQLALVGGSYACTVGCGTVMLVDAMRPLPLCPRCHRRTAWIRQRSSGTFRSS
jgi:hypothetical protein